MESVYTLCTRHAKEEERESASQHAVAKERRASGRPSSDQRPQVFLCVGCDSARTRASPHLCRACLLRERVLLFKFFVLASRQSKSVGLVGK